MSYAIEQRATETGAPVFVVIGTRSGREFGRFEARQDAEAEQAKRQAVMLARRKVSRELGEAIADGETDGRGWCVNCGEEADGWIDPDGRRETCSHCGAAKVYGAEELALMGYGS